MKKKQSNRDDDLTNEKDETLKIFCDGSHLINGVSVEVGVGVVFPLHPDLDISFGY